MVCGMCGVCGVRYECGGSLKPRAVEHAGVPRGGQGKGAYLIAHPLIIDTFPHLDCLLVLWGNGLGL